MIAEGLTSKESQGDEFLHRKRERLIQICVFLLKFHHKVTEEKIMSNNQLKTLLDIFVAFMKHDGNFSVQHFAMYCESETLKLKVNF